jgi:hypothetical protein
VASVFVEFATRATFFRKFDNDGGPHERLAVEVLNSILCVLSIFEFNKPEASHHAAVNNTAIAIEKLGNIFRPSISGKSAKIETPGHCG